MFKILDSTEEIRRKTAWEGLFNKKPFGRIATVITSDPPDLAEIIPGTPKIKDISLAGPAGKRPAWDEIIRSEIHRCYLGARSKYRDDSFPAINMPRNIYGQSQAIAEAFGCRLISQGAENEGLFFPVPWIQSSADANRLKVKPIEECLYWEAIKFTQYACEVTGGEFSIRNPVITGPLDTVNYVLGTTRLMDWIYEEPGTLKKILAVITEFLVDVIQKFQKAGNDRFCPDACACVNRGFGLCSEVRSLVSAAAYEEYEAPYLFQIGKACGPFMVHSCGAWERTMSSVLQNPYIFMLDFGCREMDLKKISKLTQGKISLHVHQSVNLDERFTWPDSASFVRYVMSADTGPIPLAVQFGFADLDVYLKEVKAYE